MYMGGKPDLPPGDRAGRIVLLALADTIIALRRDAGMSQDRLAYEAGLNRTYMGKIERAEANPSVGKLLKIFRALAVEPARLIELYLVNVKKRRRR